MELEDIKFAIIDDWRRKPHSSIEGHRNKHISVPVYAIDGTRVPNIAVSPDITVPPPWKTFTPPAHRAPGWNPKPFTFGERPELRLEAPNPRTTSILPALERRQLRR